MSMNLRNAYIRESLLARLLKHLANIETYYKLTCSVSDSKARGPGFDPWSGHLPSFLLPLSGGGRMVRWSWVNF